MTTKSDTQVLKYKVKNKGKLSIKIFLGKSMVNIKGKTLISNSRGGNKRNHKVVFKD